MKHVLVQAFEAMAARRNETLEAYGAAIELETFDAQPNEDGLIPGKPIQVFKLGAIKARDGRKLLLEEPEIKALVEDARALAAEGQQLAILAEHGEDITKGMEALGWIDPSSIDVRPNGIWFTRPSWTEDGYSDVKLRKRRYISPHVFSVKDADGTIRPRRWLEITNTNIPAISGMESIAASQSASNQSPNPSPEAARDTKEHHMKNLGKLLGLADGASEEDVEKAVTALKAKADEKPPVTEKTKSEFTAASIETIVETKLGIAIDKIAAAAEKKAEEKVSERFAAQEKAGKVAQLVALADSEGKLCKDNRESFEKFAAADLEGAEKVLATMGVVSPTKRRISTTRPGVDLAAAEAEDGSLFMTRAAQLADSSGISITEALSMLEASKADAAGGKEN